MSLTIHITRANGFDMFIGEDKTLIYPIYDEEVTSVLFARVLALRQEVRDLGPAASAATQAELVTLEAYLSSHQLDPTGSDFEWVLRKTNKAGDPALILKTTGSPGGIDIVGSPPAVEVSLYDIDTALEDGTGIVLAPKTYRYSLKRMDDGAETIAAEGDFELSEATAR